MKKNAMTMATVSPFFIDWFPFFVLALYCFLRKILAGVARKILAKRGLFLTRLRGHDGNTLATAKKGAERFAKKINNRYSRCVPAVAAEDECLAE
jgi:hypothetical protein